MWIAKIDAVQVESLHTSSVTLQTNPKKNVKDWTQVEGQVRLFYSAIRWDCFEKNVFKKFKTIRFIVWSAILDELINDRNRTRSLQLKAIVWWGLSSEIAGSDH